MSKIKVLNAEMSVDKDLCAICRVSCKDYGRHSVKYPAGLRGSIICDNCAIDYNIVCECCEAGHSLDEIITSF